MLVQDMNHQMSLDLVNHISLGRIACAHDTQPYVTPFSYVYHESYIYSFATIGKRVEWMRSNPRVCVEVDDIISREEWRSVVIFGRFQELYETRELPDLRKFAHELLSKAVRWWEPGFVKTLHWGEERRLEAIYFRISIDEITGRQAIANEPDNGSSPSTARRMTKW